MNMSINNTDISQVLIMPSRETAGNNATKGNDSFKDFMNTATDGKKTLDSFSEKKPSIEKKDALSTDKNTETVEVNNDDHSGESEVIAETKEIKSSDAINSDDGKTVEKVQPMVDSPDDEEITVPDEILSVLSEEFITQLADIYNVPVEAVENTVSDLFEESIQLFDADSAKIVAMALSDIEDSVDLISDADTFEKFVQTRDLSEELNTKMEELVKNAVSAKADNGSELKTDIISTENVEFTDAKAPAASPDTEPVTEPVTVVSDFETSENIVKSDSRITVNVSEPVVRNDSKSQAKSDGEEVTAKEIGEVETKTVQSSTKIDYSEKDNSDGGMNEGKSALDTTAEYVDNKNDAPKTETNRFADHVVNFARDNETVVRTDFDIPEEMPREVRTEYPEIINQIVERVKITSTQDEQEITMQLHPENLGNLQIKITSVNGTLTARFTAENEIVKNTIESQLVILKEQFEESGTKVAEIEVNVSANELNQSYSDAGESSNGGSEAKKRTPRRLKLDEISDEDMAILTRDDAIAVSMMEANGNSIDVTA